MATTTRAIYRKIVEILREGLADRFSATAIYLAATPVFDSRNKVVVQVIPGSPTRRAPRSSHGLIDETFDVAVWYQSFLDEGVSDMDRLTAETESALAVVDEVRRVLNGSTLEDLATITVTFLRGSRPSRSDDNYGWVQTTDTFSVAYVLSER